MRSKTLTAAWAALALGAVLAVSLMAARPAPVYQAASETVRSAAAGAQVYAKWDVLVADGETATTAPYNPFTADEDSNPSIDLEMGSFTGVVLRARYESGATMGTDPVVRVWGLKGSAWTALADVNGNTSWTLADAASTDCTDGTWKWTVPTAQIDALGCERVRATISTAGVSAGGTIRIEGTKF